jgi:hypothetical protein
VGLDRLLDNPGASDRVKYEEAVFEGFDHDKVQVVQDAVQAFLWV